MQENNPKYMWRPATRGDIGSVARFAQADHDGVPWSYGILTDIIRTPTKLAYFCDDGVFGVESSENPYWVCQIQYDGNEEP